MRLLFSILLLLAALGGVVAWTLAAFGFFSSSRLDVKELETGVSEQQTANIDQALGLIRTARDKFAPIKDYRCTYIRDEWIGGEMKSSHIRLLVRHEPFSVCMEWLGPPSKQGRKTAYVEGRNNGQMRVRGIPLVRNLDPDGALARSESRRSIKEAGIQNMINRFVTAWEKEKQMGFTEVAIQDVDVRILLPGREVVRPCTCVTTIHPAAKKEEFLREKFLFHRTQVYFDKEFGIPIQVKGYDWPAASGGELQLIEHGSYLDIEANIGLSDKDFEL